MSTPECAICGSTRPNWVTAPFGLISVCSACGYSEMAEQSVPAHLEAFRAESEASDTAPSYLDRLQRESSAVLTRASSMAERRLEEYQRACCGKVDRILEIGCGPGVLGEAYVELGVRYLGIDLDSKNVELAHAHGRSYVECNSPDDLISLGLEGQFDVVCASQVLEHANDPMAFVERAIQLCRRGGVIHFDVPNQHGLAGLASIRFGLARRSRYGAVVPPHHPRAFTDSSLEELVLTRLDTGSAFAVTSLDSTFGQVHEFSTIERAYFRISQRVGAPNILVVLGRV